MKRVFRYAVLFIAIAIGFFSGFVFRDLQKEQDAMQIHFASLISDDVVRKSRERFYLLKQIEDHKASKTSDMLRTLLHGDILEINWLVDFHTASSAYPGVAQACNYLLLLQDPRNSAVFKDKDTIDLIRSTGEKCTTRIMKAGVGAK